VLIIAISGGSASGKSSIAADLKQQFLQLDRQVELLCEDHYYKPLTQHQLNNIKDVDFDHPHSIDNELMTEQLKSLTELNSIEIPNYCYQTHMRLADTSTLKPTEFLIVEGLHLLHRTSLLPFYDLSIFVESPLEVCLERRIKRDVSERNRTEASVLHQFYSTVKPSYEEFIYPSKSNAHLVLDGTRPITASCNDILSHHKVKSLIE